MAPNDNFDGDQNNKNDQPRATQLGMQQESYDQQHSTEKNDCSAGIKKGFSLVVAPVAAPFRWAYRLTAIEKFTCVLCLIGTFQVWSFIESERAYLVVDDISFISSEPSEAPDGLALHMIVRNVGRHTATVTRIRITSAFFVIHKSLNDVPSYDYAFVGPAVPPIVANEQKHILLHGGDQIVNESAARNVEPRDVLLAGMRPGQVGFCFEFVPPVKRRTGQKFVTCENPKYTYTR